MSHNVTFRVKDYRDYEKLMGLQDQTLRFKLSDPKSDSTATIVGKFYPNWITAKKNDWITCDIVVYPTQEDSLITVPLECTHWSYNPQDYPSTRVDVVYGIGEMYPTYITPADRARYRALEGHRAYVHAQTACVNEGYWDEWERRYTACQHGPKDHKDGECTHIVGWHDGSRIYCDCEEYLKPNLPMKI